MRTLTAAMQERINKRAQTIAENADPRASVIVSRNIVPLTNWKFVKSTPLLGGGLPNQYTDIDIAVAHPKFGRDDEDIWIALVDHYDTQTHELGAGRLRVRHTRNKQHVGDDESWLENGFTAPAEACAIAFDSEVIRDKNGIEEFITERTPWVFYVDDGTLYGYQINTNMLPVSLAEANVTDVSAVRGPSGPHGGWNLGLTVFFIMNGALYYRQLIDGTWYDAELVTAGPEGITYTSVDAFNTWDYRVGVQVMGSNGALYMIYSYTEGIGTRATEHIEVSVSANVTLSGIEYYSTQETEHIEVGASAVVQLIYGLSVVPVSVQNVEDEEENWGTTIEVIFDYPVHSDGLTAAMFTLVDSSGNNYVCNSFNISGGGTGRKLTLTFDDFNLAGLATNVTLSYTKPASGGLMSPAVQTDSFSETFVPENLDPPQVDPPTFLSATNNAEGTQITVYFTEEITNADVSGMTGNFSIGLHEYNYVPNGTLQDTTRTVASVEPSGGTVIDLSTATLTDTDYSGGAITLEVDTSG